MPEINKSSRHSKITGDFAEVIVLYWLSKHGFECVRVDHTGIDLIAKNPIGNELMGISVKGRSQNPGTEKISVNIPKDNFEKIDNACKAFNCVPYFAIFVDGANAINIFILSKAKLLSILPTGKSIPVWKMGDSDLNRYKNDKEIISMEFKYETLNWWKKDFELK